MTTRPFSQSVWEFLFVMIAYWPTLSSRPVKKSILFKVIWIVQYDNILIYIPFTWTRFLQMHFLMLFIIDIVRNVKAHFGLPEYPLYKLIVLRYIDAVFKNRMSYHNLFKISEFIQRRVLSKMKQKSNMSPGFFRFYEVFLTPHMLSKRKIVSNINLFDN